MEHSAILLTFIKLPLSVETFVLPIFEWRSNVTQAFLYIELDDNGETNI